MLSRLRKSFVFAFGLGGLVHGVGALRRFPRLRVLNEPLFYLGPVVQIGGIEVGVVRPNQCPHFGVESHLVEKRQVAEGTVNFSMQDRLEVNGLFGVVVEFHPQSVGGNNLKFGNMINGMFHSSPRKLPERFNRRRFLPPSRDFHAACNSS